MTNKEYLAKVLGNLVNEDDIEVILLKEGIDADGPVDVSACDLATYNRFSVILKGSVTDISEGGYSSSMNLDALKFFYNSLCIELGKPNVLKVVPKVRYHSM